MDLRHLRYFVAVAEELHFRRAAQRLHLAQPALSKQIKNLEEDCRTPLFHRSSRKVELTEAGKAFLKESRDILSHMNQALEMVRNFSITDTEKLRVGFVTSAGYSVLPVVLREFNVLHPTITLQCFEMPIAAMTESLKKGEIDASFILLPSGATDLTIHPLRQEGLVMILPRDHVLADKEMTSLKELATETFIFFPQQHAPGVNDQIITACHQAGFSPRLNQDITDSQSVLCLVAAGLGISFGPETMQRIPRSDLIYKPIGTRYGKVELALATRSQQPNPALKSFIEICKKIANTQKRSL